MIASISVTENTLLREFLIESNQLTDLNLTANTELTNVDITMNAGFTCSNIQQIQSEHPSLIDFRFDENCGTIAAIVFPDANLSRCISDTGTIFVSELTSLSCDSFGISDTTGIEQLVSLTSLELQRNSISLINVVPLTGLTNLILFDNQLTSIDVTNNSLLTNLDVFTNQISTIDLSNNALLTVLRLDGNQFNAVNLTAQVNLQQLFLANNMFV